MTDPKLDKMLEIGAVDPTTYIEEKNEEKSYHGEKMLLKKIISKIFIENSVHTNQALTNDLVNEMLPVVKGGKTKIINRIEIIGKKGREYVNTGIIKSDFVLQDDNRTLKIFIEDIDLETQVFTG